MVFVFYEIKNFYFIILMTIKLQSSDTKLGYKYLLKINIWPC